MSGIADWVGSCAQISAMGSLYLEDLRMKAFCFAVCVSVGLAFCTRGAAQDPTAAEEEIRKAVASYVDAYNKGDAKALADLWTEGAVYANPLTGEQTVGRDAIEKL